MKVGVVGASGYAGVELLRLCAIHPDFEVVVATAGDHRGEGVARHTPSLAASYPNLAYSPTDPAELDGLDLVFLALPHGRSQHLVPNLRPRVGTIVDLAADFRLRDPGLYPRWYGVPHAVPELLDEFVYGLPELYRRELSDARLVAAPGCYPTAAVLALHPLLEEGLIAAPGARAGEGAPALVVDAASGVSGAGRAPKDTLHFGSVDGDFTAYGLLDHRHTPEMEQCLGAPVLFTPHLAPMVRGILATCYARPSRPVGAGGAVSTETALAVLHRAYDDEPFVVVTDAVPSTKSTTGSNCAHVTARVDPRTGWVVVLAAIDNLVKGAAGQAVQCANLALGLPETAGLPITGLYP
ncbi:MAG TPA: N-acetyl-gamma-glutamyl-phosphate reductase [Acidimicrobiales bacterium]|jgi:N-acetyl-gamma-glutamyl-phosphate reductase|nr:N-acetyl-gamma-glutamyl-phosphate reductase [Acidimicrobiales bacterium]